MAVLPIYEFPHEVLRKKARKVKKLDKSIHRIAEDLIDTMQNAQGVGLAANQIGILKRIIAMILAIFAKISILDKRRTKKWLGHFMADLKMGIFPKNPQIRSKINKFAKVSKLHLVITELDRVDSTVKFG